MTNRSPASSDGNRPNDSTADPIGLSVLMACHRRPGLTIQQLQKLIGQEQLQSIVDGLESQNLIARSGASVEITQAGRNRLDQTLEAIQRQIVPDSPQFEKRFRREEPSLPFAANTVWAEAFCINIRVDPEALRPLVPEVFDLDLYQGHAFVSLTVSRLKNFGAGSIPSLMRMNFYQSTYRAHVTYTDFRGQVKRGCYFVRSETNSAIMSLTANLLPEFKAHQCSTYPILMVRRGSRLVLTVDTAPDPAGKVVMILDTNRPLDQLPAGSVFANEQDAFNFIVDFHDAFSYDPSTNEIFVLQIERGPWHVRFYQPIDYYLGYIGDGPFPDGSATLDSVYYFQNCPYRWLPLIKERIRG